jgi:biopolymer transport protein ExbB
MSLRDFLAANGIFFTVVFALLSLTSVGLVIWRIIRNVRAHANHEMFFDRLEQELERGGPQQAFAYVQEESRKQRVLARLMMAVFREGGRGKIAARDAMADCIDTEIRPSLETFLPIILLFAKVAPMLGLLGTVWGMIAAFRQIAGATKVDPSALADNIGMALFTTAEGLIIAIPLIAAYTFFQQRIQRFEIDLQRGAQEALRLLPRIHGQA